MSKMIKAMMLAAAVGVSADASAQSIPSVPVPGTNGTVVIGPVPPANNPGKVITITPGPSTPVPSTTAPPGVVVTIPLGKIGK